MSAKASKKRIQIVGVRRSTIDIERFAAAIVALAQHLRDTADDQPGDTAASQRQLLPPEDGS